MKLKDLMENTNQRQFAFWIKRLEQEYRHVLDNYASDELPESGTEQIRNDAWGNMPKEFWAFHDSLGEDGQDEFNDMDVEMTMDLFADVDFADEGY